MAQDNLGADAALTAVGAMAGGAVGLAISTLQSASAALNGMTAGQSTQNFHVNKDNVLRAGKIVQDQAKLLSRALRKAEAHLDVDVNGAESGMVSARIASAWNQRLTMGEDSYVGRIRQYVDALDKLSEQLRESATQYGFTEEQITTTFGPLK